MSNQKKRILILTTDAGFGHRSAAQAIAAALEETHGADCTVDIVNPIEDEHTPAVLRDAQEEYDRSVRDAPDLYKLSFDLSDLPVSAALLESALSIMLLETMRNVLRQFEPDVIVSVYHHYLAPLSAAYTLNGGRVPVVTVVTDLTTIHRMWYHSVSDVTVVPTQAAYDLALKYGLPPEKVSIIGIPVHPHLTKEQRPPEEIRADLGWRPDLTTVLVAGSKRVQNLPDTLRALNHSGLPIQLVLIAGGDDALYQEFEQTEWHTVSHLYNFVDNMPTMLRAADCIVCKAGGLIVSEALACGLPILLVDVIEGQETGNAEYVLHGGAGEFARDPIEALEILCHWLTDGGRLLSLRAHNARILGRPRAAYDIADLVWEMSRVAVRA